MMHRSTVMAMIHVAQSEENHPVICLQWKLLEMFLTSISDPIWKDQMDKVKEEMKDKIKEI